MTSRAPPDQAWKYLAPSKCRFDMRRGWPSRSLAACRRRRRASKVGRQASEWGPRLTLCRTVARKGAFGLPELTAVLSIILHSIAFLSQTFPEIIVL